MPKLTVLLGRKVLQVYDLDQPKIRVGRDESADVVIDNPSISRSHAEIRMEEGAWVVEDLGSSNGTFFGGNRLTGPHPLQVGDEIGFGKFSIVFGKEVGEAAPSPAPAAAKPRPTLGGAEGTMHIKPHEVKEILKESEAKRRAHLVWESGGQKGTHYLSEAPAALFGTGHLCDVRVPKGPKHHVLVVNRGHGCEVRNLHAWKKMKVSGKVKDLATLKDGDVVKIAGLKLTFVGDIA
ncbi:MAG: FHA domain-containing protein [Gemmatimonadota bacterium]